MSYIPFFVVNIILAYFLIYLIAATVLFLIIFPPVRQYILLSLVSATVIGAVLAALLRRFLLNNWLADADTIKYPRWFMFFDLVYSTTIGLITGIVAAAVRVILGGLWASIRCIRLDEPLLPGAAAILDAGWLMHGSLMKCRYAAGKPPAVKR